MFTKHTYRYHRFIPVTQSAGQWLDHGWMVDDIKYKVCIMSPWEPRPALPSTSTRSTLHPPPSVSDSQDTLLRAAPQTQHKLLHYMDVVMLCAERCTVPCSATDLVSLFALITTILSSARQPAPEMRYHLHKYPHNR